MLKNCTKRLFADETGATAIEYGLLATLIAVALAGTMASLGDGVQTTFETVETKYSESANSNTPG